MLLLLVKLCIDVVKLCIDVLCGCGKWKVLNFEICFVIIVVFIFKVVWFNEAKLLKVI